MVASRGDSVILMRDVADVREGAAIPFGDAVIQGREGVLLSLSGQYGANTLEVTRALEAVVHEALPRSAGARHRRVSRAAPPGVRSSRRRLATCATHWPWARC